MRSCEALRALSRFSWTATAVRHVPCNAACVGATRLHVRRLLTVTIAPQRTSSSALHAGVRASQVGSFEQTGYYSLPVAKQITIDPCVYEVHTMRGSGPGGQGTNSSSNKVELRVDVDLLSDGFDEAIIRRLRSRETGKAITSDGATLIVSSHMHRSALQNKEDCLDQVRHMLHKASWVPPVEAPPVQTPAALITRKMTDRRRKGNALRMTRTARQGLW